SAQPVSASSLPSGAAPAAVAAHLLDETDAALARHTLLQVASLPESPQQNGAQASRSAVWAFEIPFATGQGTAVAQFEISRDGGGASPELPAVWRVGFSPHGEPMGALAAPVGAARAPASGAPGAGGGGRPRRRRGDRPR